LAAWRSKTKWQCCCVNQCCQMVYFHTKKPNFTGPWNGKCWYI
jgi:hypothetical protein